MVLDIQMDFIPGCYFNVLPNNVAQYEEYGRPSWITKCVILTTESAVDVEKGIYHNVGVDLVIDTDGMVLDNDHVAVQIAKLLLELGDSSKWMFSMRAWHVHRVFLNSANLYDHHQRHIYNTIVQSLNRQPRRDIWQYDLERQRQESANPPKKVLKLILKSINSMSSITCCRKNFV
jgi:hypothetical protein